MNQLNMCWVSHTILYPSIAQQLHMVSYGRHQLCWLDWLYSTGHQGRQCMNTPVQMAALNKAASCLKWMEPTGFNFLAEVFQPTAKDIPECKHAHILMCLVDCFRGTLPVPYITIILQKYFNMNNNIVTSLLTLTLTYSLYLELYIGLNH